MSLAMSPLLLKFASALALSLSAAAAAPCASPLDCALNGECGADGSCVCDAGWRGDDCSALDLLPAPQASGLHVENVSSWGGSVLPYVDPATGETTLFASVFENCGLTSWTRNSYIARATSGAGGIDAPFAVAGTAIPIWSHNVVALNATGFEAAGVAEVAAELRGDGGGGQAFLIFHIGDGQQSNSSLQACSPDGGALALPAGDVAAAAAAAAQAASSYTYSAGYLQAGDDLRVGASGEFATAADAEAWCTANSTCRAFTYEGPPDAVPAGSSVFFKAHSGGVTQSGAWAAARGVERDPCNLVDPTPTDPQMHPTTPTHSPPTTPCCTSRPCAST